MHKDFPVRDLLNDAEKAQKANTIQRRIRLDLCEPAELAIYNAVNEVEKLPADVRLTEAVILLDKARELVADFIDERLTSKQQSQ